MASVRVASNISVPLNRQLPLLYNTAASAFSTSNPNSLAGDPLTNAMGIVGGACVISFMHDASAALTFTLYRYCLLSAKPVAAGGSGTPWLLAGSNSALYSQTVQPLAHADFILPENTIFFIQSSAYGAGTVNLYLGGTKRHPSNLNIDLQGNVL
jgi:hypothetical protein